MVKGASAKRSPLPWRAGGKKPPVSPGAAYRVTSTNSESPYWRRGVVLPQDPLELFDKFFHLFEMPLRIVRTAQPCRGDPNDLVEVPMLPLDHYGCVLGCAHFTASLAAVEEHERGCARWLHKFLPEGLQRDLFSGDEDELALTLLDIVEPLQYPLSVLQKARRHALASPLLVDGAGCWEMPPLESADQHPAPSQKLPTSRQLTPPAAPASAPPLSSASITPNSLSLNLIPMNSPLQTGDSNLVADKTIDSSYKEKVPQQKARRHAPASPPLVASDEMTLLGPAHRHPAPSQKLPTSKQPTPHLVAHKKINSRDKEKLPQQKARRHLLASPPLVASDEMTPLGPADRHPVPSQKLPTLRQPTPPAAPTSATPPSSVSIALSPLSLNLS